MALLLSHGADTNIFDNVRNNILLFELSIIYYYPLLVHKFKLLQEGYLAVHIAAVASGKECLELLLSFGADINAKDFVSVIVVEKNENYENYA